MPKVANAFNVAAFLVLTVGATETETLFEFVDVVIVGVVDVVVVVGVVHALSQAVNLVSNSLTVMPKVLPNAAT